ncbi:hypothetical protein PC116_g24625 [Phytophthora cactorum]|nr:hypothetical protein PC116_g24625 [Phytophthora cactorum]
MPEEFSKYLGYIDYKLTTYNTSATEGRAARHASLKAALDQRGIPLNADSHVNLINTKTYYGVRVEKKLAFCRWHFPISPMRRKRKYEDDQEVEIDLVADALAQLPSPPQGITTAPPTYRLKETIKDINSSVICKLAAYADRRGW